MRTHLPKHTLPDATTVHGHCDSPLREATTDTSRQHQEVRHQEVVDQTRTRSTCREALPPSTNREADRKSTRSINDDPPDSTYEPDRYVANTDEVLQEYVFHVSEQVPSYGPVLSKTSENDLAKAYAVMDRQLRKDDTLSQYPLTKVAERQGRFEHVSPRWTAPI